MPRKSAAALAIVTPITDHRPPPPDGLTDEQQEEWRAVVSRMPNGWFPRETHALLVAYIGHVTAHRLLSAQINRFESAWLLDDEGLSRFDKLLRLRERESRSLSSAATRLRLTPASRYRSETAASAVKKQPFEGTGRLPWMT